MQEDVRMLDVDKTEDLQCVWCENRMQDGNPAYAYYHVVLLSNE